MTASLHDGPLVNRASFSATRAELGPNFARILGYFDEDGRKSVSAIEEAMRAGNAAALVLPAHTLKGEAQHFGAEPLAYLAEAIEMIARDCVETRQAPDAAIAHVVKLRPLFAATMDLLSGDARPLLARKDGHGRRTLTALAAR